MQPKPFHRLGVMGPLALVAAGLLFCTIGRAEAVPPRHGVLWYTHVSDPDRVQTAAQRYELGITGRENPENKITMKTINPDFKWFVYNSGTDNYVSPNPDTEEHDLIVAKAQARGVDVEDLYLHYYNDTVVNLGGTEVTIPGWGGGSAVDPADARIPVYYNNLTRRVVNFSTPAASQIHRETWIDLAFGTPFTGSTIYPDGIFLDNSAYKLFNYGILVSGGEIREVPGHPVIGSAAFQDWHWNQNYGPFLTALKDTLETSPSWAPDGKRKYVMMNIANIWTDDYVARDATDYFFMEFEYNPVRNFGLGALDEARRRDVLAASAGMSCFYAATMTRSVPGKLGEYNYDKTLLGNLAWYLLTRTDNTLFFEFATASPHIAGWDTLTWRGCLDVANSTLGEPLGDPYTFAEGNDPLGNAYRVKARAYEGGLVLVRNRGEWNQGIEPQTAVTLFLPGVMAPVDPTGNPMQLVNSIKLRNGEAAIMLGAYVPVDLLSFTAQRTASGNRLDWEIAGDPVDHAGFHVYRETASGSRERITGSLLSGARSYSFLDPDAPADETVYWLEDLSRSGTSTWHGPVTVEAAAAGTLRIPLAQNRPNPFRADTRIAFATGSEGQALLRIYDVTGREVARLFDQVVPAGSYEVTWNGRDEQGARVAPGVYFYRLETADLTRTRKLTLIP